MKIGVISDTHDYLPSIPKAVAIFKEHAVGLVIHCGDWIAPFSVRLLADLCRKEIGCPIKGIFGNNDGDEFLIVTGNQANRWGVELSKGIIELEVEGRKIVVYHGTEPVITEALVLCKKYDAVFTGHTHLPVNRVVEGVFHLNPGAACYIRGGQMVNEATVAVYDTISNTASLITL